MIKLFKWKWTWNVFIKIRARSLKCLMPSACRVPSPRGPAVPRAQRGAPGTSHIRSFLAPSRGQPGPRPAQQNLSPRCRFKQTAIKVCIWSLRFSPIHSLPAPFRKVMCRYRNLLAGTVLLRTTRRSQPFMGTWLTLKESEYVVRKKKSLKKLLLV